ncbi:MAG: hypothetical protein LUD68_08600 [Rikenellaceae bacterium]|nr:hypothetical protein [Rikenellaceae bacterium]
MGKNPDLRIVIVSYSLSLAARFNRQVQRVIDSSAYGRIFPETRLKKPGSRENYIRTAEEFEVTGHAGGLLCVGREGDLTGNPVDVMIIDDLYKDAMEGNSPVIREHAWNWYVSVVKTRLHNGSRELIVMTRWHPEDLIGQLYRKEIILPWQGPGNIPVRNREKCWLHLNFQAIKEGLPSSLDPRPEGAALWPERQSIELLREKQTLDPVTFQGMYQGNPDAPTGLLYADRFRTYTRMPEEVIRKANYTDTADTGQDYLCSICYETDRDGSIYITDMVYTQLSMEYTEQHVALMLERNGTRTASIESNNGGGAGSPATYLNGAGTRKSNRLRSGATRNRAS